MNPLFRFDGVDVVLNRNSLKKLLDFCKNTYLESFRLNLFIVNDTLFIERCAKTPTEIVRRNEGYGRNFEKAFTKPPKKSTGHHRVLRYHLGNLNCVVRFEVDASYQGNQASDESLSSEPLVDTIGGLNLSSSESDNTAASPSKITTNSRLKSIYTAEETMPQSMAAKIKTFTGT